jgi:hypothetical protein
MRSVNIDHNTVRSWEFNDDAIDMSTCYSDMVDSLYAVIKCRVIRAGTIILWYSTSRRTKVKSRLHTMIERSVGRSTNTNPKHLGVYLVYSYCIVVILSTSVGECSVLFCIYDSSHMIEIHCHWLCMSTHRPYNVFRLRSTPYTRPNSAANHAPNPTLMTTKTLIISSLSHHGNSIRSGCSMVTRVEWWRGARVRTCRIWQRSDARGSLVTTI